MNTFSIQWRLYVTQVHEQLRIDFILYAMNTVEAVV